MGEPDGRDREERILTPVAREEERGLDGSLRPVSLAEFVGQRLLKEHLAVYIAAAQERREALDHVLLYGPPGLGKTSLAHIIARELGVGIRVTSGPAVERPGDLASILTNLAPGDVLFIDEIHRLSRPVEEILYPALEDFALDLVLGRGPSAKTIRLDLPRFTLVGATTRAGALGAPLRDRFGIIHRLDYYEPDELADIVRRAAGILGIDADASGAAEIACRARGTPRVANRLLRRLRDFAQVWRAESQADGTGAGAGGGPVIDAAVARRGLDLLEVDGQGLDRTDRRILEAIAIRFEGGPVGLETLAALTAEEPETIEDVYEPYLMQLGFLQRTPRGRAITAAGLRHLGLAEAAADREGGRGRGSRADGAGAADQPGRPTQGRLLE